MMDKFETILKDQDGELFVVQKSEVEKIQERMKQILEEAWVEDLTINAILWQIQDEIEKKTGKRPVFGPWSIKNNVELSFEESWPIKFDI